MRAGVGLVGLLVAVGLMMYLFAQTQIPIAKEGKEAQDSVRQTSGHGDDGESAESSFTTDADYGGGGAKLKALVVTNVTTGGAMQTYYGLLPGDRIVGVNGSKVNDVSNGDDGLAKALVAEAFQKRQTLTVDRAGQSVTLPVPAGSTAGASPAAGAPAPAPSAPAPAPGSGGADTAAVPGATPAPVPPRRETNPLYDQIQGIQDAAAKQGQDE